MRTSISTARIPSAAGPNTLSNVKNSEIGRTAFAANRSAWLRRSTTNTNGKRNNNPPAIVAFPAFIELSASRCQPPIAASIAKNLETSRSDFSRLQAGQQIHWLAGQEGQASSMMV
ncbi:MAG TPA: hypothetical protein VGJ76_09615 [Pseudolabrys sp.]